MPDSALVDELVVFMFIFGPSSLSIFILLVISSVPMVLNTNYNNDAYTSPLNSNVTYLNAYLILH